MLRSRENIIKKLYEEIAEIYKLQNENVTMLEMQETILLYYNTSGYDYKSINEIIDKLL